MFYSSKYKQILFEICYIIINLFKYTFSIVTSLGLGASFSLFLGNHICSEVLRQKRNHHVIIEKLYWNNISSSYIHNLVDNQTHTHLKTLYIFSETLRYVWYSWRNVTKCPTLLFLKLHLQIATQSCK